MHFHSNPLLDGHDVFIGFWILVVGGSIWCALSSWLRMRRGRQHPSVTVLRPDAPPRVLRTHADNLARREAERWERGGERLPGDRIFSVHVYPTHAVLEFAGGVTRVLDVVEAARVISERRCTSELPGSRIPRGGYVFTEVEIKASSKAKTAPKVDHSSVW